MTAATKIFQSTDTSLPCIVSQMGHMHKYEVSVCYYIIITLNSSNIEYHTPKFNKKIYHLGWGGLKPNEAA